MNYFQPWLCAACSAKTFRTFLKPNVPNQIRSIVCSGCQSAFVKHKCESSHSSAESIWLKLLEAGVPALCLACGPVYSIAKKAAASPAYGPTTQQIAAGVCVTLLLGVAIKFIDDTFFS